MRYACRSWALVVVPEPRHSVTAADGFPDALDEARAQAARGIHDMMADALEQYGRPDAKLTGEAEA